MLPWNQDFVEVIPEVQFITKPVSVVYEVLFGGDKEALADGICVVDALHIFPRLISPTQTWCDS